MKKLNVLTRMLLLVALLVGSTSVWADAGDPQWSYAVVNGDASKLSTAKKTFTIDESHVFSYDGSTVAAGSPSVTIGSANSTYAIKFGSSGSVYFNPVVLTTDAFEDVAVTKVRLYLKHNGSKAGSLTVKQGDITIGTATTTSTSSWINVTCSETNTGAGGTLEIKYEVAQALYINKIEVWYEDLDRDYWIVTYKYNDGVTADYKENVNKGDAAASYTLKTAPSRDHYNFDGWKIAETTYDASASYPLTSDVTATAQWEWDGSYITYNKSNKSDLATGAKYIMVGSDGATTWMYATAMGTDTYLHADDVKDNGELDAEKAHFVLEEPVVITLNETEDGWTMTNESGQKIGLKGDKKLGYDEGDVTWALGGTDDIPTFTASYSSSDYIMKYNSSDTRFNAYKSGQRDVYYYRLDDGKDIYTLTLNFNDGATDDGTHRVLEGASYTLTAPTRAEYTFTGWNTAENGTGTSYPAGAYTMPAAATTLYAQWRPNTVSATVSAAGWATYVTPYAVEFSEGDAYVVTNAEESTTLTEVTSVSAGTPVLLKGAGEKTATVIASAADPASNLLKVSNGSVMGDDENIYVLANKANGVGFYLWDSAASAIPAGKVYLDTKGTTAKGLEFISFENAETDGIRSIEKGKLRIENSDYYNLAGQRVGKDYKGIVIVNGKKMLNK